mmetsp:Transcript_5276/g.11748  ORF Transcript_5276/g.11748 Transcript_5276/m.11748 type:complete len:230 (+) Transcript_5276:118-807(+)
MSSRRIVRPEPDVDMVWGLAWLSKQPYFRRLDLDLWLGFLSYRHLTQPWREAPRNEVQTDFDLVLEYEAWLIALLATYQCLWTGLIFGDSMYNLGFVAPQVLFVIPVCGYLGVRYDRVSLLYLFTLLNWFLAIPLELYHFPALLQFTAKLCHLYNHYPNSNVWPVGDGNNRHDYTPLSDGLWIVYHVFLITLSVVAIFVEVLCGYYALKLATKMSTDHKQQEEAKFLEL